MILDRGMMCLSGNSLLDGVLQDRISGEVGWEQITYTYDPSGRRIAKDVDGVVTRYVYDGDQCIAEYDANDVQLRKYIYGPGIDQPICMIEAAGGYAGTYYYHFDALGSVVALSDADGDTVQVYEYDVYGQVAASDPNHPNRFMFTGREFDTETGLYYYRARYYNPSIGRFLQTDPAGYEAGMNLYRYCLNNPTNLTDPFGLMSSLTANEAAIVEVIWAFGLAEGSTMVGGVGSLIAGNALFATMIMGQIEMYFRDQADCEWLRDAIIANDELFAANPTLKNILDDDRGKRQFFNHHFPNPNLGSGKVYDVDEATRIFLEAWEWFDVKPPVDPPQGDWGYHFHPNPNKRGIHVPITREAYEYLISVFFSTNAEVL